MKYIKKTGSILVFSSPTLKAELRTQLEIILIGEDRDPCADPPPLQHTQLRPTSMK